MNDPERQDILGALRACIGRRIFVEGRWLQLHDVLAAEGLLVFAIEPAVRDDGGIDDLQLDLHGEPRRRARQYCSYPAFENPGNELSTWALALLTND